MGEKGVSETSHLQSTKLLIWLAPFSLFPRRPSFLFLKKKKVDCDEKVRPKNVSVPHCSEVGLNVSGCGITPCVGNVGRLQLEIMNPFLRTCIAFASQGRKLLLLK